MRRDRLGRRIGRNWWRETIVDTLRCADHAWYLEAEAFSVGHQAELDEFRQLKPRPQLKAYLLSMKGWRPAS